jgi:uncharacterized protein (DUF58 family)
MKVKLSSTGFKFILITIFLLVLSWYLVTPITLLIVIIMIGYLISYPIVVRNIDNPKLKFEAKMRNNLIFRNEIEVLQVRISNFTNSNIPFLKIKITIPNTSYFINFPSQLSFNLEPNDVKMFNIPLMFTARGVFQINPIELYMTDSLGLYASLIDIIDDVSVRVFPSRLGKKVSKSEQKLVFSKLVGLYSTRMKGIGTDFHGLRDYIRGDPSKTVYWPATATRGKLITKEFEQEKRLEVYIIVQGGGTMKGSKFDFVLGISMDLYQGIIDENQPCGYIFYDDQVRAHFDPSTSQRQKMKIWSSTFDIQPRDTYADYNELKNHIMKKKISNSLLIFVGDLENNPDNLLEVIRKSILNKNQVIFLDVWGYVFSYQQKLTDAAADHGGSDYGHILNNIIGKSIEYEEVFDGFFFKMKLQRLGGAYGFVNSKTTNIITVLQRALYSRFGRTWRTIS